MAQSTSRRRSWRSVTPVLAVAAFGLVACTNSQESSDVTGTTPPVCTSSPAPAGAVGRGRHATGVPLAGVPQLAGLRTASTTCTMASMTSSG